MSDALDAVAEAITRTRHLAAKHLVHKQELEAEIAQSQDPARTAAATTELQAVTQDYQDALSELAKLGELGRQSQNAEARTIAASAGGGDPLIRTYEEIALDNAREHVADLVADARLTDELAERPPVARAAPPSREEADAAARAEFEALRAKLQQPSGETSDRPLTPPKKTL